MSKLNTGVCRFCGQTIAIETEESLTSPQLAEEATMRCTCEQAVEYQKERQRKEKAMMKRLRPVRTGCSTGETCRRGDCEHIVGSSRGDIHRRTGKGHVEPQRGGSRHRFLRMPRVKSMWNAPKPRNRN